MNCYSRYFSTTDDVRTERVELKPKFMRSTSLQDGSKPRESKTTLDFSAPFSSEKVGSFEQLKINSEKPTKSAEIKYEGNREERKTSGRNDRLFSTGIRRKQLGNMRDTNSRDIEEDPAIRLADVCATVKPRMKQYCQCFKEKSETVIHGCANENDSEKFQNALRHLVEEDIPSEIKCAKCHLEIQEEWRRRKMVIESWMEFFGSRGTSNSVYTYASSV